MKLDLVGKIIFQSLLTAIEKELKLLDVRIDPRTKFESPINKLDIGDENKKMYAFSSHIPDGFLDSHVQLDRIQQDRLRHSENHIFVQPHIGGYETSETQILISQILSSKIKSQKLNIEDIYS